MGEKREGEPSRNQIVATVDDCFAYEQMVQMGLLRQYHEVAGFRAYRVTEAGADAVGLWLPEE
jgi:hypothetical protein